MDDDITSFNVILLLGGVDDDDDIRQLKTTMWRRMCKDVQSMLIGSTRDIERT